MISNANDGMLDAQLHVPNTTDATGSRPTLTLVCMASLLACAFSATSAIEIGSTTHPFTNDKAGREVFGHITTTHAAAVPPSSALARIECLIADCQSIGGPIVRITAPPQADPQMPPHSTQSPAATTPSADTVADDADDETPPPLPAHGYSRTGALTDVTPLPTAPLHGRYPHYVEVTLPADTPWFALPSVALDPDPPSTPARTTIALDPVSRGG